MKIIVDITLKNGVDKQEFVGSFDPVSQVDWWNMLKYIPNCVSVNVEKSFLPELKLDERVVKLEERPQAIPSSTVSVTGTVTALIPPTSDQGSDYLPLQFYLDSNQIQPDVIGQKVGRNETYDDTGQVLNATYTSKWNGKNVDIVTLEVGPVDDTLANVHDSHPDFIDIFNPLETRVIPMNWLDLEDASNNQVSSNSCLSDHGMGVLSAAGGAICGYAKESSLRAAYITSEDGVVECINAIISWHNNKTANPLTGLANPTIMIAEYQYLQDRRLGIPIDYISSINTPNGTINRPGSSWGTDFTAFVENNIIPFSVRNPDTLVYEWCIVLPSKGTYSALHTALEAAWDAGIVCVNAAGNNGGVFRKTSDYSNYTVTVDAATPYWAYLITFNSDITTYPESETLWYPFLPYGPHGLEKGIDVAAGYNSEGIPVLDSYSNRGPGIDVAGLGDRTWTAFPNLTYADGNKWGMFSGTSCATPTVVGKLACIMERFYEYSGVWPSPQESKNLLLSGAKEVVLGINSIDWTNAPSAGGDFSNSIKSGLVKIFGGNGNGGYTFTESAGTTRLRAYFNATLESLDKSNFYGKRPQNGLMYPRTFINRSRGYKVSDLPAGT